MKKVQKKAIIKILIVCGFAILLLNIGHYSRNEIDGNIVYPIIRFIELGILVLLIWKQIVSLKTFQYIFTIMFIQVIVERLIISPVYYVTYSSLGALICLSVIAPTKNAFRWTCLFIFIIYWSAVIFGRIEFIPSHSVALTTGYLLIYMVGSSHIELKENVAKMVFFNITKKEKYENVKLTPTDFENIKGKIQLFLSDQEKYMEPSYTVEDLAKDVGVPRTMLSKVLSIGMETNFSQLLNEYRIDEVKKRLKSQEFSEEKILSIAFDCGFSSKSSFNSLFKKHTGMTPREYREA